MEYCLQQKGNRLLIHIKKTGVNPKNMISSEGCYEPQKVVHYMMILDIHGVRRNKQKSSFSWAWGVHWGMTAKGHKWVRIFFCGLMRMF